MEEETYASDQAFGIICMTITLLAGAAVSQATSGFAPIEIRLVAQEPGRGRALPVAGSGGTIEVERETLLGPADFAGVGEVEWTEGKPGFNVALTPAGAQKYEQVSTGNVGRTLAIIVDGRIHMTPKILDPVRAQGFLLTMNTEAEARQLAATVRQAVAAD